jgi:hypothetical protein
MAEAAFRPEDTEAPRDGAPSVDLNRHAAQTRELVRALREELGGIRQELSEIKSHARTDHFRVLGALAAGFIVLLTGFAVGYMRVDDKIDRVSEKVEDKFDKLSDRLGGIDGKLSTDQGAFVRVQTQLDDLIARIPPVQSPPPHR